jgi:hypothetical protein
MYHARALVAAASLLTALVVAAPAPAEALTPSSAAWTPVAPRSQGDGYAATTAQVDPWLVQVAADGAVVLDDRTAARIRRIDPGTGRITSVAGDGTPAQHCSAPYGVDARTASLPAPLALAPAPNGDLYELTAGDSVCNGAGVIRLDHADHQWHLVVSSPSPSERYTVGYGDFTSIAVGADGTLYVTDGFGRRVLAYPPGSDPHAIGQVVAGTGTAGIAGDGGLATAAQVTDPTLVAGPGELLMYDATSGYGRGTVVRRLDLSTGVITRIAGTGTAYSGSASGPDPALGAVPTSADMSVDALGVDPVTGQVVLGLYRQDADTGQQHDIVAFAPGGLVTDVRHTVDASDCYTDPGIAVQHAQSRVLAYCTGELRAWRTDGTDSGTDGALVAGLDRIDGTGTSATGATLENEYAGQLTSIATSASGAVAISGRSGVRTVASLTPTSPVSVLTTDPATAVDYAADGSLWWTRDTAEPALVRETAGGPPTVMAGGGTGALVDGAAATSVKLPALVDVAADSTNGVVYFLAESGDSNETYVGRRFIQLWSLTVADSTLHLVAGDTTSGLVVDGEAASAAPLGDATAVAVDTAHHPLVSTDSGVFRVSAGVVHGPLSGRLARPMSVQGDGTIVSGSAAVAADGSYSGVALANGYDLTAPLPDGTWVSATSSVSGSLLERSDVVTPATGLPAAKASVAPGPGSLTVTVTPPATAGLGVSVSVDDQPGTTGAVSIDYFVTDGTTSPHTYVLRRYGAADNAYAPKLDPALRYRVDVSTQEVDLWTGRSVSSFASPLVDSTAPSAPVAVTWSEPLHDYPVITVTPADAPDLDHVVVCEQKGTSAATSPDVCSGVSGTALVQSPATPTVVPLYPGSSAYSPVDTRTFTAWSVDIAGNVSAPTSRTVPGATAAAAPGIVPGIEWSSDGASVVFRFRADPQAAAIVAGTSPPPVPAPYGGVSSGRVWVASGLTPGHTYTAAFYRWSADSTHYTPTTVTFVAGSSSSDSISVLAPSTVGYAARPVVRAVVRRVATGSGLGSAPLPLMPVELWRRTLPSTTWVKVGSATTGADGSASWTAPVVGGTTSYQVRVPAQGYMYPAVGASSAATVRVRPIVGASLSATATLTSRSVRVRTAVPVTVRVAPHRVTTYWVQRYVSGRWSTVRVATTSSLGVATYRFTPTVRGTSLLRVVTLATTTTLAGLSRTVTVTAT